MNEDLLFFLFFAFIVGINILARNKGLLKKITDTVNSCGRKSIPPVRKHVRNRQKALRRQKSFNKSAKKYSSALPQIQPREVLATSRKSLNQSLKELDKMYSNLQKKQSFATQSIVSEKNMESTIKTENIKLSFDKKSMKEAVILKEILDLPLALR